MFRDFFDFWMFRVWMFRDFLVFWTFRDLDVSLHSELRRTHISSSCAILSTLSSNYNLPFQWKEENRKAKRKHSRDLDSRAKRVRGTKRNLCFVNGMDAILLYKNIAGIICEAE
jgi:hypothetical protein